MSRSFGAQNMHGQLRKVLVRRPGADFAVADPGAWNYSSRPDASRAGEEHDAFVAILREAGCYVIYHQEPLDGAADAIFVHDPVLVTDAGAIQLAMGKALRRGEPEAISACLENLDIPVIGRLEGEALAEGGDLLWIDEGLLAAGRGLRTNDAGIAQLRQILEPLGVDIISVPLPYGEGAHACLHLMSLLSIVDTDLAVAYKPLLPVPFVELMESRGFHWVEVPHEEFASMGANVLALGPRQCLVIDGNPLTRSRLEAAGCSVRAYVGDEISLKAEGGATCLTRPILRDPAR